MIAPRIFRIILPVRDLDEAARFYATLLGIPGARVSGGRHYFDCGGVILACLDPRGDGDDFVPRPNQEHLYFAVRELEQVHARARELRALAGGDVHGDPAGEIATRPWGERSFYAHDPTGNPLCFVDDATLFTGKR